MYQKVNKSTNKALHCENYKNIYFIYISKNRVRYSEKFNGFETAERI